MTKWYPGWLPDLPCDVCQKNKATHWYGGTSHVLCDNPLCEEEEDRRFEKHCAEIDALNEE